MKTKTTLSALLLLVLSLSLLLTGCGDYASDTTWTNEQQATAAPCHSVTFVTGNGSSYSWPVEDGSYLSPPEDPVKKNYLFLGWYTDSAGMNRYDFSRPVTEDLVLHAKFEVDAKSLTNTITEETIRSVVRVNVKNYNKFWFIELDSISSHGSGVIFSASEDGYFYVLTNCHVAVKMHGYDKVSYTIEDYMGRSYKGYLYKSAIDPEYDLACLYFKTDRTDLYAVPLAKQDPKIGEDVIALGHPKGQANAVAFGVAMKYETISLRETEAWESNVTFDILTHTAYSRPGSSGGPVLNTDLALVGIHYAANSGEEFERGYAIPISRIREFLDRYVYAK